MTWTLIFITSMTPYTYQVIGWHPDYETCRKEMEYQAEESNYFDKWACVQLPSPPSNP